jgi:hypothetical protein
MRRFISAAIKRMLTNKKSWRSAHVRGTELAVLVVVQDGARQAVEACDVRDRAVVRLDDVRVQQALARAQPVAELVLVKLLVQLVLAEVGVEQLPYRGVVLLPYGPEACTSST